MSADSGAAAESRLPSGTIVVLGALVFAIVRQGAYHAWQHQVFTALLILGGAVLLAATNGRSEAKQIALAVSPLLLASMVSLALSEDRSNAGSTFLMIGLISVGLLAGAATPRNHLRTIAWALLGISMVVAATAMWGVATHTEPWGRTTAGIWRGSSSLTYANAAAAVLGPATLMALGLAAREQDRRYAAVATFTMMGLAATQSRGGAFAFALAACCLVIHVGVQRFSSTVLPIALGAAVGLPVLLLGSSDASDAVPALTVGLILAGIAVTAIAWPFTNRLRYPVAALLALTAMACATAATTPLGAALTTRFSLRSGTTFDGPEAGVLLGDRSKTWTVAWEEFTAAPVFGHGPGAVDLTWTEEGRSFSAMFVHNEYLELLITHGVVGLTALAMTLVLSGRYLRLNSQSFPFAVALLAFALHSAFDFLWHIPALPVFFSVSAGAWLRLSAVSVTNDFSKVTNQSMPTEGPFAEKDDYGANGEEKLSTTPVDRSDRLAS